MLRDENREKVEAVAVALVLSQLTSLKSIQEGNTELYQENKRISALNILLTTYIDKKETFLISEIFSQPLNDPLLYDIIFKYVSSATKYLIYNFKCIISVSSLIGEKLLQFCFKILLNEKKTDKALSLFTSTILDLYIYKYKVISTSILKDLEYCITQDSSVNHFFTNTVHSETFIRN